MVQQKRGLTRERLLVLMVYDPITGDLFWRENRKGGARAGQLAGSWNTGGYRQVYIDGSYYLRSHLVWLIETGAWPADQLDHRDRNRANDRIGNLRPATNQQNQHNKGGYRNNTSGYRGVSPHGGRWQASIRLDGRTRYLGLFDSPAAASAAYEAAKKQMHPFEEKKE